MEQLSETYASNPVKKGDSFDLDPFWFGKNVFKSKVFIPLNINEIESSVLNGSGYVPKTNNDIVAAYQDAAEHGGAYNPYVGYNISGGTSINDLQ
jgi:hypothetical protein